MAKLNYEKIYSSAETSFGGGKPEPLVVEMAESRSGGKALELGAGDGRNARFLAGQGFEVTALDQSPAGIEKLSKLAKEQGLAIDARIADIRQWTFPEELDAIVCTYVLQHLSREEALALIRGMQEHTKPGGRSVITAFTSDGDFFRLDPSTKYFYPKPGELRDLFKAWKILHYEETSGRARETGADGQPLMNVSAKIIAEKPL